MTDGSDYRKLQSPEFARRERKRNLWAGVGCAGMGLANLVWGVNSMRTGEWVGFGRVYSSLELPGWVVILMGLFLLYCSGAIVWRFRKI